MNGKSDEIKGKLKEAAGVLTEDDGLKHEGRMDQLAGEAKQVAEKAIDSMKQVARKLEKSAKS